MLKVSFFPQSMAAQCPSTLEPNAARNNAMIGPHKKITLNMFLTTYVFKGIIQK